MRPSKCLRAGDLNILTKIVSHPDDHQVFAYARRNGDDQVLVILNFSPGEMNFQVKGIHGLFRNVFGGRDINFDMEDHVYLRPWGYLVFEKLPMLSE